MNFLNLPSEHRSADSAYKIIPVPYERNTTYGNGQENGPSAIIEASNHLEYFDTTTNTEPYKKGILTAEPIHEHEDVATIIDETNIEDCFPVVLGGDHSVTIPAVKALPDDVDVITFDAHADMRYSWKGSQTNHACVTRQLSATRNVTVLGVRSMDRAEHQAVQDEPAVSLVPPEDVPTHDVDDLGPRVHVSIDVDCFDPSIISQTGTPVPGGLTYKDVTQQLREIFDTHDVVSADIVEFAPDDEEPSRRRAESFSVAKLLYHVLALKTVSEPHGTR